MSVKTKVEAVKHRFGVIVFLCVLVSMLWQLTACGRTTINSDFAGGDGTLNSPYKIETTKQLDKVRDYLDSNFILNADIDLSDYESWKPIGLFESLSDKPKDKDETSAILKECEVSGGISGGKEYIGNAVGNPTNAIVLECFGTMRDSIPKSGTIISQ